MSMFCFQCQEAYKNEGCVASGMCGKKPATSNLMDLLVYNLKGVALLEEMASAQRPVSSKVGLFLAESLFITITNANFDNARITAQIQQALQFKRELRAELGSVELPDSATWEGGEDTFQAKAETVGILSEANEDLRSLQELVIYGLKGIAAYADHAAVLGYESQEVYDFFVKALAATTRPLGADELTALALETGKVAVTGMALLDEANTKTYGHPEITEVNLGVGKNPGILVSGHDLLDLAELLEQTEGTGVDVYTHSEMLPAHSYPELKKHKHLVGNYGNAWWQQDKEFESFNGVILMTTNCIVPVRKSYADRIYTTGMSGYPGVPHVADRPKGGKKDFSALIARAKFCAPPQEIESGTLTNGFAHQQVLALADKVVDAIKSGAIKRFVVMGGCDGRQKERDYFTQVARQLPKDTVILTAGCAKYRYNKLELGDIGGIPRVLDAGQCNDSYSLAVIALKLKEAFGLEDINELPISFDLGWYEQKAIAVLLALLHLGVKGIRVGPTLPAFLSPNVAKVLVEAFDLKLITTAEADIEQMMVGA
ncbi:MAG: Hydroxylamine reductase [Acidobacteria bacterium ADurb.Bin340]|nr:MAG: Hydroxylamine reductase [Acidobacteria bacterium ADurb.Bin340]